MNDLQTKVILDAWEECWGEALPFEQGELEKLNVPYVDYIAKAIRNLRTYDGRKTSPGLKVILGKAKSLWRESTQKRTEKGDCPWCLGRKFVIVSIYRAQPWQIESLPEGAVKQPALPSGDFLVKPEYGQDAREIQLRLRCGHCPEGPYKALWTIKEYDAKYGLWLAMEWEMDKWVYENCLRDSPAPPPPAEPMPDEAKEALENLRKRLPSEKRKKDWKDPWK